MTLYCAFCGKSQQQVVAMVAGPTCSICDECVEACVAVLSDAMRRRPSAAEIEYQSWFERSTVTAAGPMRVGGRLPRTQAEADEMMVTGYIAGSLSPVDSLYAEAFRRLNARIAELEAS